MRNFSPAQICQFETDFWWKESAESGFLQGLIFGKNINFGGQNNNLIKQFFRLSSDFCNLWQ